MINPTEYLPKSYRARLSTYWWLTSWAYLKFILREGSAVFVAWAVIVPVEMPFKAAIFATAAVTEAGEFVVL